MGLPLPPTFFLVSQKTKWSLILPMKCTEKQWTESSGSSQLCLSTRQATNRKHNACIPSDPLITNAEDSKGCEILVNQNIQFNWSNQPPPLACREPTLWTIECPLIECETSFSALILTHIPGRETNDSCYLSLKYNSYLWLNDTFQWSLQCSSDNELYHH